MQEKVIRKSVDGGSAKYWQEQREGFVKVRRLREAFEQAERDWRYDLMDEAIIEASSHPGAVRILTAWGQTFKRTYWDSYPALVNKEGLYTKAREIPVFGKDHTWGVCSWRLVAAALQLNQLLNSPPDT